MGRKLSDLYVIGEELEFTDDDQKETVKVWVQKLVRAEQQEANKKANAKKALFSRTYKRDGMDSPDVLAIRASFDEVFESTVTLIEFLLEEKVNRERTAIEAQIAADEKWAKDGYLDGLFEEWNSHLKEEYAIEPQTDESVEVYNILKEYVDACDVATEDFRGQERELLQYKSYEVLESLVMDKIVSLHENLIWLAEYRRQGVFFATRNAENHSKKVFDTVEDTDEVADVIYTRLVQKLEDLTVNSLEGKE